MKGRPLAKQGYEQELSSIKAFVSMQNKSDGNSGGASATDHGVSTHTHTHCAVSNVMISSQEELKPDDLVGARLLKKKKPKEV